MKNPQNTKKYTQTIGFVAEQSFCYSWALISLLLLSISSVIRQTGNFFEKDYWQPIKTQGVWHSAQMMSDWSRQKPNPIRLKTNILRTLLCFQPCHTSVCLRFQATQCTQNICFQVLRSFKRINFCRDKKESGEMLTHFEHFCRSIGGNLSLKTVSALTFVCFGENPQEYLMYFKDF